MADVLPIVRQPAKEASLRIGDIARLAKKSTRAMRLYEEMNLLGDVVRTDGGHRLYSDDALLRVAWIDKLQALGFSLTQIREMLSEWSSARQAPKAMGRVREIFQEKLEHTRAQLETLHALADELTESLAYLESCGSICEPATVIQECNSCERPHPIAREPGLVAGFHTCGHAHAAAER